MLLAQLIEVLRIAARDPAVAKHEAEKPGLSLSENVRIAASVQIQTKSPADSEMMSPDVPK